MKLKEKLLSLDLVIDNEYLDKYCELCNNPINDSSILQEKHHKLPRSAFLINNLDVDDSEENIISLDIRNHCLAHYYLILCSSNSKFKFGNIVCVQLLTKRNLKDISEKWIINNLHLLNEIRKEQRRLNSELQKGLQEGLKNGNVRYSLETCNNVKRLLLEGLTNTEINKLLNVPLHIISKIKNGNHWSCKLDNFKIQKQPPKTIKIKKETRLTKTESALQEWNRTPHFCKNCGIKLTNYLKSKNGDGLFCSKHCSLSWSSKQKFKDDPELKKKIFENRRTYKGEGNPNYGKKASLETREKISNSLKQSEKMKNSSRFKGHKHSEESKRKTSETLCQRHREKPMWKSVKTKNY